MMVYMYIHVVSRLELITPNTCTGFIMKKQINMFSFTEKSAPRQELFP